jgi:membrane protease YdiL (CAAX protease family)
MGFFRRYQGRGSYDLLSNYNYFMPGFIDLIWVILLFILGSFLGSMLLGAFILSGYADLATKYGMLIAYPLMFVPPMLYASAKSRREDGFADGYALDNNNFGKHRGYTMAFAAIVMSIATAFVIEPVSMLLPEMPEDKMKAMEALLNGPAWVTFISVCIFAPFFEEWLCRGIVLRGMLKHVKPVWAIIISALFFALIHMNLWQAVPAFLMGLAFGYVYYKTGSLKLTMLMHMVNNATAFTASQIPALKEAEYFTDVLSPWAYGGIYAAAVIALISGIILLKGIPKKEGDLGGCRLIKSLF